MTKEILLKIIKEEINRIFESENLDERGWKSRATSRRGVESDEETARRDRRIANHPAASRMRQKDRERSGADLKQTLSQQHQMLAVLQKKVAALEGALENLEMNIGASKTS